MGALPAFSATPEWAAETIEDIWVYSESERAIRHETNRRQELQSESELVIQRINVKESILDEIEHGTMTLAQAANRFREMDADRMDLLAVTYPPQRLGSFDEIAAQSVVRHMWTRAQSGRAPILGTMKRLTAEFERMYGYDPTKV